MAIAVDLAFKAQEKQRHETARWLALARAVVAPTFLLLFVFYGQFRGDRAWQAGIPALVLYCALAWMVLLLQRRWRAFSRRSALGLPLLDLSLILALDLLMMPHAANPQGLVNFNLAGAIMVVLFTALALDRRMTVATATAAALLQGYAQVRAGAPPRMLASTAVLLAVAGAGAWQAARLLERLVVGVARRMQEIHAQMASADRLANMGTLAASLAHEINNPLAALMMDLELRGQGGLALDAAKRIAALVRDLKVFSHGEDGEQPEALQPAEVVQGAVRMTSAEMRHRARLTLELGPAPRVRAVETRLAQVLVNLLVNAAQAVPQGQAERHEVRLRLGTDPRGWALIEVADTGCGMSPEVQARIFEPFFTTKPAGQGTGLGLPICRRLVEGMGGALEFRSQAGLGSVFRVLLPPAPEEAAPAAPARAAALQAGVQAVPPQDPAGTVLAQTG